MNVNVGTQNRRAQHTGRATSVQLDHAHLFQLVGHLLHVRLFQLISHLLIVLLGGALLLLC